MKFCPECGGKLDSRGYCKNCGETYGAGTITTNSEEFAEFLLFKNFLYENNPDGTYTLVKAKNKSVKKVVIPASVSAVSPYCFMDCNELVSVVFLNEMRTIPEGAFLRCRNLTFVQWPDGVERICVLAFSECDSLGLTFAIPEGVTRIDERAFFKSKMTSITLPSTLKTVERDAFAGCEKLFSVELADLRSYLNTDFRNEKANPNFYAKSLSLSGDEDAFMSYTEIPSGVSELKPFSLAGSIFGELHIPSSVVKISPLAFYDCNNMDTVSVSPSNYYFKTVDGCLTSKDGSRLLLSMEGAVPAGTKVIAEGAFCAHTYLYGVNVPVRSAKLENGALFGLSGLEYYEGPLNGTAFNRGAVFSDLFKIKLHSDASSFSGETFGKVPDCMEVLKITSLCTLGRDVLSGITELSELTLPSDLTKIEDYALSGIRVPSLTIPSSVTEISSLTQKKRGDIGDIRCELGGRYTVKDGCLFDDRSKRVVTCFTGNRIPADTCVIGKYAYSGNTQLGSVTLGGSIHTVESKAFEGCPYLTSATVCGNVFTMYGDIFSGCRSLTSVIVQPTSGGEFALTAQKGGTDRETLFASNDQNCSYWFNPSGGARYGRIVRGRTQY